MGDQPVLMRVGGDVAALTNALAGLDAVQIEAQAAALAQFLASTAQAADLARLSLETVKAKAGATDEQIDQADLAFKSAVAAARAAAAEGRIISRLIKARQATLGAEAKEARRDDPAERTWSELSERFLAIAKDGGRVPTTADEAGSELHAATVRIRRIKPRKTNHQAIWEALERLTLEWPEPIRPTMALCAREASFATEADESLPAAEGAAARRKGRKQASDQERGDREPPSQAALLTGDDEYHADAAEYRALVRAWMAWVQRQDLRPDANCGWLQAGMPADTGTDQLRIEFVHQHQLRNARLRREDVAGCVDATVRAWRDERRLEILAGILGGPSTDEGRAELRRMIKSWTSAEPLPKPEDEAARHELYVAVRASPGCGTASTNGAASVGTPTPGCGASASAGWRHDLRPRHHPGPPAPDRRRRPVQHRRRMRMRRRRPLPLRPQPARLRARAQGHRHRGRRQLRPGRNHLSGVGGHPPMTTDPDPLCAHCGAELIESRHVLLRLMRLPGAPAIGWCHGCQVLLHISLRGPGRVVLAEQPQAASA